MRGDQREKVIKILSSLFLMIAITACDNGEGSSGGGITIIDNREPSNNTTGVWDGTAIQGEHTVALSYNLVQSGSDITGTCTCSNEHERTGTITGTMSGNSISLSQTDINCSPVSVTGTVNGYTSGSTMDLTATRPSGGGNCPAIHTSYTLTKQ